MRVSRLLHLLALFILATGCVACGVPTPSLAAIHALPAGATMLPFPTATPAPTLTPISSPTPPPTISPTAPTPTPTASDHPLPAGGPPTQDGTVILVSIGQQWLWAYQDHHLVFDTPVVTGRPGMETPTGTFTVLFHREDMDFTGWNPPEHVNYGLYFHDFGYYIHDASWRQDFGPGTNVPHLDAKGQQETGSHGCVEVPVTASAWLYQWAQDHLTQVLIVAGQATQPSTPQLPVPQPTGPLNPHRGSMIPL